MGSFALRMAAFEESLGDMRVVPNLPVSRWPVLPAFDPPALEAPRDDASSWTAYLSYVDAYGVASERRFTCRAIIGFEGATHVTGFCHERMALRTFRVDRIRELACAETGEMFDPVRHFDDLRSMGALRCEDKVLTDVARIMVFLARCDGEYHPLEADGIAEHINRYCVRFNATAVMADDVIAECRRLAPDSADMSKAIRKIAKSPGGARVARFVLDAGAAVIDADGHHAAEETLWAAELSTTLKAICDGRVH